MLGQAEHRENISSVSAEQQSMQHCLTGVFQRAAQSSLQTCKGIITQCLLS